jgi:hypothetical protein
MAAFAPVPARGRLLDAWSRLNALDPMAGHEFLCRHAAAFAELGFIDDHSIETCRATFHNTTARYAGFPDIPPSEIAI